LSGSSLWPSLPGVAIASLASLVIVAAARRLRALTVSGAIAAFCVGTACLGGGGLAVGAPLLVFFLSGTLLSRANETVRSVAQKGATRDAAQVLANGGVAAVCAAAAGLCARVAPALAQQWIAASVCALSVAAADTWATEIGGRSAVAPRSIVTGKPVRPGVSGGVTALGFLASLAGAAVTGSVAAAFVPSVRLPAWLLLCAAVGFGGAALDSVLGATLQSEYRCVSCDAPCEAEIHECGRQTRLRRGLCWLDNDRVNAVSTLAGAVLGFLAFPLVR
jgi:uncharacterized protein (TIGR00297 family)